MIAIGLDLPAGVFREEEGRYPFVFLKVLSMTYLLMCLMSFWQATRISSQFD